MNKFLGTLTLCFPSIMGLEKAVLGDNDLKFDSSAFQKSNTKCHVSLVHR